MPIVASLFRILRRRADERAAAMALDPVTARQFYDKGVVAYAAANFGPALGCFQEAAKRGSGEAMANLGVMFEQGNAGAVDYTQAMHWYRRAADLGNDTAMYNIGVLYVKGHGVRQDYAAARSWFQDAADLGHAKARLALTIFV